MNDKSPGDDLRALIDANSEPLVPLPTDQLPGLTLKKPVKAVLFDIYGTMLISGSGDIGTTVRGNDEVPLSSILRKEGIGLLAEAKSIDGQFPFLLKRLIEEDHRKSRDRAIDYPEVEIREIWKRALEHLKEKKMIEGNLDDSALERAVLTYECLINPVWPMPGLDSLLGYLYEREYRLGIVSNAQFYTKHILKRLTDFRIGKTFFPEDLIFFSYALKVAKPSKELFSGAVLKLKKLYNINPEEVLYIGNDMLNDIYTASLWGCATALFAGDRRSLRLRASDSRCRGLKPDLVITHLEQLIEIL